MDSKLEVRRSNNEPKCASCGWWQGKDAPGGRCDRHGIVTLDLAVCSDWRDGELIADILPPEKVD